MLRVLFTLFAVYHSTLFPSFALAGLSDLANCDPSKKDRACPPDPAFAKNTTFDFVTAGWNAVLTDFWTIDNDTENDRSRLGFSRDGSGMKITMEKEKQAPTLTSNHYLFFGKVTAEIQAAKGNGIITSFVLMSDSGDEIDWELVGAYDKQAQSNYFYNGEALFNTYNQTYVLDSSAFDTYHTYSVEWNQSALIFAIDGNTRRTFQKEDDIPSEKWPQTPMQIKIGTWAVSSSSDKGEIAWAGGAVDWSKGPYDAYIRKVDIVDYMGGCEVIRPGANLEYSYDERSHGWTDVDVVGCKDRLMGNNVTVTNSPTTPTRGVDGLPQETGSVSDGGEAGSNSGHGESNDGSGDEEGSGELGTAPSSTLAALICVGWLLIL